MGRGGSDTTAVALAEALKADQVIFYKDVDGFYDKDPRQFSDAKLLKKLNYQRALEYCEQGANILHQRAIQLAKKSGMPLEIWNVYTNKKGSEICN